MPLRLVLLLFTVLPAARAQESVVDKAKAVFRDNCRACHYSKRSDEDPYEVFESFKTSGLPRAEKIARIVETVSSHLKAPSHMPPGKVLPDADLKIIRDWADSQGGGPPAATSCQVVAAPVAGGGVTDAQAAEILRRSCGLCHGRVGDLSSFEKSLGGVFLAASTLLGADALRNALKQRKDGAPASCSRAYTIARWLLKGTAVASAGTVGLLEGVKLPHTPFLNEDGTLHAPAFAEGEETLARLLNQIVGVDGSEFMPPRTVPKAVVGHYSDADKTKLAAWIQARLEEDLSPTCKVHSTGRAGNFADAVRICNEGGMRLPTGSQLTRLAGSAVFEIRLRDLRLPYCSRAMESKGTATFSVRWSQSMSA